VGGGTGMHIAADLKRLSQKPVARAVPNVYKPVQACVTKQEDTLNVSYDRRLQVDNPSVR